MSMRPASIFEKSRMSLMIVSSASPTRGWCGVVVLLGVERRVEQQAAHADHGVHRRADLVAHRGEEAALRLVRRLRRGARFLRLPEERTFWIAITAWLANVSAGDRLSLPRSGLPFRWATVMAPMGHR
jgi:hypothetical protein